MRILRSTRGQALMELAIFGTLMIMALAFIVRIGFRFNHQQKLAQDAFRDALFFVNEVAMEPDGQLSGVTYTIMEDRQVPSPGDPFGFNPRTRFTGGTSFEYGKHLFSALFDERPPVRVYMVNGDPWEVAEDELPQSIQDRDEGIALEVEREITQEGRLARTENGGDVNVRITASKTDTITTRFLEGPDGGTIHEIVSELEHEVDRATP